MRPKYFRTVWTIIFLINALIWYFVLKTIL